MTAGEDQPEPIVDDLPIIRAGGVGGVVRAGGVGGLAPTTPAELMRQALAEKSDEAGFAAAIRAQQERRLPTASRRL